MDHFPFMPFIGNNKNVLENQRKLHDGIWKAFHVIATNGIVLLLKALRKMIQHTNTTIFHYIPGFLYLQHVVTAIFDSVNCERQKWKMINLKMKIQCTVMFFHT